MANKTLLPGKGRASVNREDEAAAFDRLPPEIRAALRSARFRFCAASIGPRLKTQAPATIAAWIEEWDDRYAVEAYRAAGYSEESIVVLISADWQRHGR